MLAHHCLNFSVGLSWISHFYFQIYIFFKFESIHVYGKRSESLMDNPSVQNNNLYLEQKVCTVSVVCGPLLQFRSLETT